MRPSGFLHFISLLACFGQAFAATPKTDVMYGHYEVQTDYVLTPGNINAGWRMTVSYNLHDDFNDWSRTVRLDPESTVIIASPGTQRTITNAVSRLGPVGDPLWLLPQNNVLGTPFMGARAMITPGTFQAYFNGAYTPSAQGSISLRLLNVTGSGPDAGGKFALWESDGAGLYFYFGPGTSNLIPTLPPNAHSHFNWGFTKPGSYDLEIEASGRLNPQHGGALTSSRKTFHFAVPHSSRLQAAATVRMGRQGTAWHMLLEDAANRVAYHPQQGFLEASSGVAQSTVPGASHQMALEFSALGSSVPDFVGVAPASSQQGLPVGMLDGDQCILRLKSVSGPGRFALISPDGGQRWMDSGDGIDTADAMVVSRNQNLNAFAVFGSAGLYRVEVAVEGVSGGAAVAPQTFTLVFGAGLRADFTYAQWSDSFERTHGLAAGALSNARADFDNDGMTQAGEFLLFWHGCDPAKSDSSKLPRPRPDVGNAIMDFYRDTYKDTFTEGPYQISPSTSTDLIFWATRSPRVDGRALETFETGAEEGNAYGRIMLRRLRVISPQPAQRGFFRFVIKPD